MLGYANGGAMRYTQKSFTVGASPTKEYRDNWDLIFGKEQPKEVEDTDSGQEKEKKDNDNPATS
jgi:hypothetical protein